MARLNPNKLDKTDTKPYVPTGLPVIDLDVCTIQRVLVQGYKKVRFQRSKDHDSKANKQASIFRLPKRLFSPIVYGLGALVLHDSCVSEKDNATFLDSMEDYFSQSLDDLQTRKDGARTAVDERCLNIMKL